MSNIQNVIKQQVCNKINIILFPNREFETADFIKYVIHIHSYY